MGARRFAHLIALFVALCGSRIAHAHPMGNFSVNHFSKIDVLGDRITIRYILDLAEIPTFQELQKANLTAAADDPVVLRFVAARGVELGHGLSLAVGGRAMPLKMTSNDVIFPAGAGGLPTMKMGFVFEGNLPADADRSHLGVQYADANYEGQSGWKEIVAGASAGGLISSSVPEVSRSAELSNYPTDLLNSPPQDLEATLVAALTGVSSQANSKTQASPGALHAVGAQVKRASAAAIHSSASVIAAQRTLVVVASAKPANASEATQSVQHAESLKANRQATPRNKFTELIAAQRLSFWFLLTAALISVGLGALHALEPGHGKTIVATYLVGSRGTGRHALLLGLIVTASHTVGVFALGAITLYASRYIVPEQLYPWLGALSGISIAALGIYMLMRRLTGTASDHSHAGGSSHDHWSLSESDSTTVVVNQPRPSRAGANSVGLTQLLTLGITGGIVPCPAALVVLLSAFALHRIGLGFFLIVTFSIGLAAALVAFGMAMVYARRLVSRLKADGPMTKRWLPAASSAFIVVLGISLAFQSLAPLHLGLASLSRDRLGPFLFVIGLGLVLGMRHSTDADHVVAISTIVCKERSIRNAALIGSVWGLGHTFTVFGVGALIILFGVEIPPRLGLSMEFSVAVMLVLLGVLNLAGVMKKVTERFSPRMASLFIGSRTATQQKGVKSAWLRIGEPLARLGAFQLVRPLAIGLVHGLAGSAAVALLVLSTIHDPVWAMVYLLVFGAGTMAGMMLMTTAISVPLAAAGNRSMRLGRYFGAASGIVSLCFGAFLVYQLGVVGGLFTGHPHWTPQ